jgi:2,3-dihydroxybenzoate-AMP ligase
LLGVSIAVSYASDAIRQWLSIRSATQLLRPMYQVKDPIPGVVYPSTERLRDYVQSKVLRETTLIEELVDSFQRNATRVAFALADRDMTYGELDSQTDRLAAALIRLGLKPLDRVLFQSANSSELITAVIACFKAGLIPVCTLPAHREREIEYLGVHTGAAAHIVQGDDPKFDLVAFALKTKAQIPTMCHIISIRGPASEGVLRVADLIASESAERAKGLLKEIPRDPYQVVIFQLSGGTTGVPKVIPRMQNDYLFNAESSIDFMEFSSEDVLFMPMPMIHNAAMICFWIPSLLAGSTFCIPENMTPEAWGEIFSKRKPTFIGLIRALLPRLDSMLELGLGSLERVRGAWAPDASLLIREKYGIIAQPMFGMSEGLNMYCRSTDPEEARDWTVGRPVSVMDEVRLVEPGGDKEVRVGEVGEFTCRGPYTLNGYYDAPERNQEAFTQDGFYRSGDLMVQRQIGDKIFYAFAGRTKDSISRGHEKINCEDVESGVSTHPAVAGCAVVGMPDPILGERVCAYLVLRTGGSAPSIVELGRHLEAQGFAKFKWPERIEVIPELPLTKVGKLDKAVLRDSIRNALAAMTSKERADKGVA